MALLPLLQLLDCLLIGVLIRIGHKSYWPAPRLRPQMQRIGHYRPWGNRRPKYLIVHWLCRHPGDPQAQHP